MEHDYGDEKAPTINNIQLTKKNFSFSKAVREAIIRSCIEDGYYTIDEVIQLEASRGGNITETDILASEKIEPQVTSQDSNSNYAEAIRKAIIRSCIKDGYYTEEEAKVLELSRKNNISSK